LNTENLSLGRVQRYAGKLAYGRKAPSGRFCLSTLGNYKNNDAPMNKHTYVWMTIITIVLMTVAYSAGQVSNSNTSQAADINLMSKCANDGQVFYLNFQKEIGHSYAEIWFDPQFHFNSKLNTCLVYIQWNDTPVPTTYKENGVDYTQVVTNFNVVKDIYSNKAILQEVTVRTYNSLNGKVQETDAFDNPLYQDIPNSDAVPFRSQLKILMDQ
jgi:hypothetical protein